MSWEFFIRKIATALRNQIAKVKVVFTCPKKNICQNVSVISGQASCLEDIYKDCAAIFTGFEGIAIARPHLHEKGQFLFYYVLSDQFRHARAGNQQEILQTDSLIAQVTRWTEIKSFQPKERQMKDATHKALSEHRILMPLHLLELNIFRQNETVLVEVETELQKATI